MRILIAEPQGFSAEALTILQGLGTVDLRDTGKQELHEVLRHYDVLWFRLGFRIDAADLPEQPRCRFIVCPATGIDHIHLEACAAKGIQVLSLRGETAFLRSVRATAELTIGLCLSLLRHIPQAVAHTRAGGWTRDLFQGTELLGKTVGIAGMGRLGRITAGYFQAFGCRVIGYDPVPFGETGIPACDSLEQLLEQSDIISIHIQYTPENHHLFDAQLLSHCKPGAVLINTARGALIDSAALIQCLENKRIAAAALDVIEGEHTPENAPLLAYARTQERLMLSPHIGGNTRESFVKTEVFMAEKLQQHVQDTGHHSRP